MMLVNETSLNVTLSVLQLSETSYVFLCLFHTICLVIAIVGNSIVLYGILCFNALNLDRIVLIFILNLTVIDLALAMINGVTVGTTLYARRWVAGREMCFVQGMLGYIFIFAELHTLVAISFHRVLTLIRPLSAISFTETKARTIVLGIWVVAVGSVVIAVIFEQYTYFQPSLLSCNTSGLLNPEGKYTVFTLVIITMFGFIPLVFMVISNIMILVIASRFVKKQDERVARSPNIGNRAVSVRMVSINAAVTVSLISWVFIFSVAPLVIRATLQVLHKELGVWAYVVQTEAYFLNVTLNPVVYTFTVVSFRNFLKRDLLRVCCRIKGNKGVQMTPYQISNQEKISQQAVNLAKKRKDRKREHRVRFCDRLGEISTPDLEDRYCV
eukprot:sb/3465615/